MASGKKSALSDQQAEALRALPSVEELIEAPDLAEAIGEYGRELVVDSARIVLERTRRGILAGKGGGGLANRAAGGAASAAAGGGAAADLTRQIADEAASVFLPSLKTLVNATGVVVHTNLGRSVLAPEAIEAVVRTAASYSNLEYNLEAGARGSRHDHINRIIMALTGAEGALVVNNNAAAVFLALAVFGSGHEVVVSRGELVEIGGSFRIPDIMASSAARMVEVGTTNKTKISDYEKAIGADTTMLLHVHTSNYKVVGFTAEVGIAELARLGHERGLVVVDDLGSGVLAEMPALAEEPSVHDSLAAGADVVTFSGDKLLGGPQAGIIVGRKEYIEKMKAHPLARALRVDKMTLAALQATLALYLKPELALEKIPTLRMLSEPLEAIKERAEFMAAELRSALSASEVANMSLNEELENNVRAAWIGDAMAIEVQRATSKVGGGALPLLELDSYVCSIRPAAITVDELATRLRETDPPVIGRIHKERLLLDARTVLPEQLRDIASAFTQALQSMPTSPSATD
ncbi:MAG: L-seryl-tRNA(Sec) selenium transferase [Thermoleophilia bacterium]|nr:L-seryl-tRNA(Sec) selenium transferase [Thermoleophilia bacterium]